MYFISLLFSRTTFWTLHNGIWSQIKSRATTASHGSCARWLFQHGADTIQIWTHVDHQYLITVQQKAPVTSLCITWLQNFLPFLWCNSLGDKIFFSLIFNSSCISSLYKFHQQCPNRWRREPGISPSVLHEHSYSNQSWQPVFLWGRLSWEGKCRAEQQPVACSQSNSSSYDRRLHKAYNCKGMWSLDGEKLLANYAELACVNVLPFEFVILAEALRASPDWRMYDPTRSPHLNLLRWKAAWKFCLSGVTHQGPGPCKSEAFIQVLLAGSGPAGNYCTRMVWLSQCVQWQHVLLLIFLFSP